MSQPQPLLSTLVRSQIHRYLRVGPHHLYVLGRLGLSVSVYSQQVRAINVAYALAAKLRPESKIAVVGGGVAGLTAAAAAAWLGFRDVTLYERDPEVMTAFRDNTKRHLHPHMYEWPHNGWDRDRADLPILDWEAGTPQQVAQSIEAGWQRLCTVFEIKQPPYGGAEVVRIRRSSRHGREPLTMWLSNGRREEFHAIVLAVGFGKEQGLKHGDTGYWSNDTIDEVKGEHKRKHFFISGCGDGGLIDYLRTRLRGFDQSNLISRLLPDDDSQVRDAKDALLQIEKKLWQRAPTGKLDEDTEKWLLSSYWDIKAEKIQKRIYKNQRNTKALLTSRHRTPLEPGAFILNRFLALQVLRVDGLKLDHAGWPLACPDAPFKRKAPLPGSDDYKTIVITRHGPESELCRFRRLDAEFRSRSKGLVRGQDQTCRPGWTGGEREQEGSSRWALTEALMSVEVRRGHEYLFDLLKVLRRFCDSHQEPSPGDVMGLNLDFVNSRRDLTAALKDVSLKPNLRERQRLLAAFRRNCVKFGWVLATAQLAVVVFEEALWGTMLTRFAELLRKHPKRGLLVPGDIVPIPVRSFEPIADGSDLELTGFALLPEHRDYEVRCVWCDGLPEVSSPREVGVLVPNHDPLPLTVDRQEGVWTAQLEDPEQQWRTLLTLLDIAADQQAQGIGVKALVMPELSTSPNIVKRLRKRLASWGGDGLMLAAGSYQLDQNAATGPARHESVLLIAGSEGRQPARHTVRKNSHCFFFGSSSGGSNPHRPQVTVFLSYSSVVVCLVCADLKHPTIAEVMRLLRPSLLLVPACTGERLADAAFELARSSGTIVVIAQGRGPSTPQDSGIAAFVVGPAGNGVETPKWSLDYPSEPQVFRPPGKPRRRRSDRGAPAQR